MAEISPDDPFLGAVPLERPADLDDARFPPMEAYAADFTESPDLDGATGPERFTLNQVVYDKATGRRGYITRATAEGYFCDFWNKPEAAVLMTPDMITPYAPRAANRPKPPRSNRAREIKAALIPLHQIKPVLQSRYLVKGWLDRAALSVIYGESNVGKTFFALDLSMHVAAAQDWHGYRVPKNDDYAGRVVYIAGEGGFGIHNRVDAIRRERPHLMEFTEERGDFVLLPTMLDLTGSNDAWDLVAAIDGKQEAEAVQVR